MKQVLYGGGPILTMDEKMPRAEALLTEDGRISAVGPLAELEALAPEARRADLRGHTLLPSFVDGHSHLCNVGLQLQRCNLTGCRSFAELLDRIIAFRQARNLTHGEILSCRGYDQELLAEHCHPTAALLDGLGFDNPILCTHCSGHMSVCSSAAMALCGVSSPMGFFAEGEQFPITTRLNRADDEQVRQAILDAQEIYLAQGITTAQEICGIGENRIACYEQLAEEGLLKVDVVLYVYVDYDHPDCEALLQRLGSHQYHGRLKLGGLKLMLDGSPQVRTAWLRQPYEGEASWRGRPTVADDTVRTLLRYAVEKGLQPIAHSNGDAAAEQFLTIWEQVISEAGHGAELRPVLIHAQLVGDDQLDRMAACGMTPSFFVGHCWYWGDVHRHNLGSRALRISPIRSALDRGLSCSLHQDSPVTPVNMLHTLWCAVNRLTESGFCLGPEQRITVEEALRAATVGGAYGYFEEDQKGILAPGFRADLLILDRDPTAIPSMELQYLQVLAAIKDGICQYSCTGDSSLVQ